MALEPEKSKPVRRFRYSDGPAAQPQAAAAVATLPVSQPALPGLRDDNWRWVWIALILVGIALGEFFGPTLGIFLSGKTILLIR